MNGPLRWVLAVLALVSCSRMDRDETQSFSFGGHTMGVEYSVRIAGRVSAGKQSQIRRSVSDLLAILDSKLSTYRPDSEVCRFSALQDTNWYPVSGCTVRIVEAARYVSEMTDGAFDVTADPLVRLWGFGPERKGDTIPSGEEIEAAHARVGFRRLHSSLEPPALRKEYCNVSIDLSGIAKGFAVGEVANLLNALGTTNYLVTIGGELCARGKWMIGIEKPGGDGGTVQRTFELRDAAASTSGGYRNFFEKEGRHYQHVLDPRTGRPVTNAVLSATVIHPNAARADALATAFVVMGAETAIAFADTRQIACLFVWQTETSEEERQSAAFAAMKGNTSSRR